jgi:hypothetical protein
VIEPRKIRWAGYMAHMGERRGACRVSVGKYEGKRSLRKLGGCYESNIKTDLKEVVQDDVNCANLA